MPFRRLALKRRRNYRKRSSNYVRGSRMRRRAALSLRRARTAYRRLPLTGFGSSKMVRFRYVEQIALNPGVDGLSTYYFRCNSLYDPNYTGVGHKPMGVSQILGVYFDHYTVVGAKIKVTPTNQGFDATGTNAGVYGVYLDDNPTPKYTNASAILESRLGKGSVLLGNTGTGGPNKPRSATRRFSARKFFGSRNLVGKSLYRGTATSSPTEDAYFAVWYGSIGGNDPDLLNFIVEIEYVAVMTEPKELAQS